MRKPSEGKTFVALLAGDTLAEVGPFRFTENEREDLVEILSNKLRPPADFPHIQSFLEAAEVAAATFKQYEELEKQRPAARATHATMAELRQLVPALRKAMEERDSHIQSLLLQCLQHQIVVSERVDVVVGDKKETEKSPEEIEAAVQKRLRAERARYEFAENFVDRFVRGLATVDVATEMMDAILSRPEHQPKRGRKAAPWRVQYAVEVALSFRSMLEMEPTATRGGDVAKESVFVSVFRVCLRAVGDEISDVHAPAAAAIRRIKEKNKRGQ